MTTFRSFSNAFAGGTAILVAAMFGIANGHAATKPLQVKLKAHVQLFRQNADGSWETPDEAGPADLTFNANLIETGGGGFQISTAFVWRTRTKKGKPYSVRLLAPAEARYNPGNGTLTADARYEIIYDRKRSNVSSKPTTEFLSGPAGGLKGERVKGKIGTGTALVKLVSVNEFRPVDNSPPLILVCRDEYEFVPKS
jgi:hypothetical protein